MKKLVQFLLIFIILSAGIFILSNGFSISLGQNNYWDHHGVLFLFFLSFFPRLALLFSSVASGGLFWWLAWVFAPRILVACLATVAYWHQNPILVCLSWLIAIGGESTEKVIFTQKSTRWARTQYAAKGDVIDIEPIRSQNKLE